MTFNVVFKHGYEDLRIENVKHIVYDDDKVMFIDKEESTIAIVNPSEFVYIGRE
ncbi:hypothetical protein [Lentibacillus salicampi]|uniref:hypothetical protein n=1 Tax=Lentibacillus salicampi TaxID=175306 RepID=UPI0014312C46|nr:hypothetical protein [Lentibacillus salicampi]